VIPHSAAAVGAITFQLEALLDCSPADVQWLASRASILAWPTFNRGPEMGEVEILLHDVCEKAGQRLVAHRLSTHDSHYTANCRFARQEGIKGAGAAATVG